MQKREGTYLGEVVSFYRKKGSGGGKTTRHCTVLSTDGTIDMSSLTYISVRVYIQVRVNFLFTAL